jgi:DNA-directed RNA polymerase subunit F
MNAQKIAKFIWEELMAFLAWAVPTIWNMFAKIEPKGEIEVTGVYQSEDGYMMTEYSDGSLESGPPSIK